MLTILTTIAGVAMTLSYYPQLIKLLQSKNPHGLSLPTYLLFGFGTVIWTAYGIVNNDWMIIASFGPGAIGSWAIAFLIAHYRHRHKRGQKTI
jgi:uncharacterized protein with PQ loop repeat